MERWLERPYLLVFLAIGALCREDAGHRRSPPEGPRAFADGLHHLCGGVQHARDLLLALRDSILNHDRLGRGAAFEPRIHVWGAGLIVFPLMLLYTVINYSVFRGKVQPSGHNASHERRKEFNPTQEVLP